MTRSTRGSQPIRLLAAATASLLAVSLGVMTIQSASAAPSGRTFTAELTNATAQPGGLVSFGVTLTNSSTSTNDLGSAQIVVPAGFANVAKGNPATFPIAWQVSFPTACSSGTPAACSEPGTTLVEISTPNVQGADKLGPGQSITLALVATAPTAPGPYTFYAAAKNSAAWSDGQLFSPRSIPLTFTVQAPPATQLAFSTQPPESVTAGGSFSAAVSVLDAAGVLTNGSQSVSLTASGSATVYGDTTVAAFNGVATFTGLSIRSAGSYTLTATSNGLASAISSPITVNPGAASQLFFTQPPETLLQAGGSVTATVALQDQFGNQTASTSTVTLTVSDLSNEVVASDSRAAVDGIVSLAAGPITGSGTYSVAVSGLGTPSTSTLTVSPGPASHLEITSVIDEDTGEVFDPLANDLVDIVVENRPFTVTVRTLDAFGNVAPVTTNTVISLTKASGPPGSLGGTLTGSIAAGASEGSITGSTYSPYGNGVVLAVSAPGLTEDTITLHVQLLGYAQTLSPGVGASVVNPACADATPQQPICGSLLLPKGALGRVLLAQGKCAGVTNCLGSPDAALLVNGKANLQKEDGSKLYTKSNPATLVLKCDKTLCGGGGVTSFKPWIDLDGDNATFADAPPCPAKGKVGANQTFCFDTRQSTRDNAGDLIAYVLFVEDIRGSLR
jgi:uncharacterized surface protein with fasciclin (FAS1) repeats